MKSHLAIGRILLVFLLTLLAVSTAWAGWEQVDQDGNRTLLSNGRIKNVTQAGDEVWFVMDLNKGEIMMINAAVKAYASGTIEEYCGFMKNLRESMMAKMKEMGLPQADMAVPEVQVKKAGDGGQIAGFKTIRYEIMADGELVEELWLTEDAGVMKEMGSPEAIGKIAACGGGLGYEASPDYLAATARGWEMKSVSHEGGETEIMTLVTSLEKKDIPEAEFQPPSGFRKVDFKQVMGMP